MISETTVENSMAKVFVELDSGKFKEIDRLVSFYP